MQGDGNVEVVGRDRALRYADLVLGAGVPAFVGLALLGDSGAWWWSRVIVAPVALALAAASGRRIIAAL